MKQEGRLLDEIKRNKGAIAQEGDFIHQGPLLKGGADMSRGVENF